jgi:PAS domain S-box-containing protein
MNIKCEGNDLNVGCGQVNQTLRMQAEAMTCKNETGMSIEQILSMAPDDIQRMFHDLQVHQIELEMQNEELRRLQLDMDAVRQRYFDLYDLAPVGYCTVCREGKILEANLTLATLLGRSRSQLIGRQFFLFIHPEDRYIFHHHFQRLFDSEEVHSFDLQMKKDPPQIFWAHLTAGAVLEADASTECRIVITDISDLKKVEAEKIKLEARLQQSQKMESIGTLAGGIAHDLNNILFPISGLAELLLEDFHPDSLEYEMMQQIHRSVRRGSDLVRQILTFSRQSTTDKQPVRLQSVLKEALKLARAFLSRHIELKSEISPKCGIVMADLTQIHQVMMNLVTNAAHAVEENGGTIHVMLTETVIGKEAVVIDEMPAGRYACMRVSDTGVGIAKHVLDKIFTPYFTTKAQGKGTGLGLSVVLGIVKDHGGDIRVYSEIGKGTAVSVYLPLIENAIDGPTDAATRVYPTGNESILLVDDEAAILNMEKMVLEKLGYRVTTCSGSLEALEIFKADPGRFDLVISDRGMPKMTGEVLAREMMAIRPKIPIILCTGFSDEGDDERARAVGIRGYLMKPVAKAVLAETIRNVLDGGGGPVGENER